MYRPLMHANENFEDLSEQGQGIHQRQGQAKDFKMASRILKVKAMFLRTPSLIQDI